VSIYPHVSGPNADSDPALGQLIEQLRARHHDAICGALLYGSCLRNGNIYDGLVDLYLICDSYRAAYGRSWLAAANWVLPPNVFYAELKPDDETPDAKTLHCKVTVISLRDFQHGCSRTRFESYIWGRFAQPTSIIYSRDEQARSAIENSLLQAARTLLQNAVPALPEQGNLASLWEQALALSYATELRTESSGRAGELAQSSQEFYATLTRHHANSLGFPFTVYDDGTELRYKSQIGPKKRRLCALAWSLRRGQGKLGSIMRVVKALFTFEGALDYFAWKMERHTGEKIVIPDKVRRVPLIFLWGFCWDLYRRGLFK
jgi:hypothetical protein